MKIGITLLLVCLSTLVANGQSTERSPASRPNIVFILTDDHRADALGYVGNRFAHTPEMDKLARTGTYFKNAVVTTPICTASRATILSGMHERTHKYTFQAGTIRSEYMATAYPKLLKEAGYYTGFYGKLGVKYNHTDALFDVMEDYDRNTRFPDRRGYFYKTIGKDTVHLTRYTGQKAVDFIQNAPSKQPFCLSISFSAPHAHDSAPDQYFWDEQTANWLENETIPPPPLSADADFNQQPEAVKAGFSRLRWTWRFDTPEKYQRMVKGYYRMIAGVDLEVARIRAQLKQRGLDKNTVIIVMGDNGYFLGERQLADKWLMYDASIRVPLIVYDPRANHHQDVEAIARNIDVPSTILDLAGVKQPAVYQGKSLRSLTTLFQPNPKAVLRDTVLIEHLWAFESIPPSEGVRTNDWKYFRYVNDKSLEELYHLKNDPTEATNLAKDETHRAVLTKLRQKTDQLIARYKDPYSGVPTGLVTDSSPNFSWVVPNEAVFQLGYQLLVASSKTILDNNLGDVWDSRQVRSSQSTGVPYTGPTLKTGVTYFWKVRIWDTDNRTSDYSAGQAFRAGEPGVSEASEIKTKPSGADQQLWNIEPQTPGGAILNIRPQLGKLTQSQIELPTMKGTVRAAYQRKSRTEQLYQIELPANVSAELTLTYSSQDTVLLNGNKVNTMFSTIRLSPGMNRIELIVNTY